MGLDRAPGADAPDDLSEQPDAACAPFLLAILGDIATAAPKTFRVDDRPDDVSAVIEALIHQMAPHAAACVLRRW